MHERNELKVTMSKRAWMLLGIAVFALIAGCAVFGMTIPGKTYLGILLLVVGLGLAGWVALGRRVALISEPDQFVYRARLGRQTISWRRLSSLQFKNHKGSYYATDMIVVNDMGRKQMQVPLDGFDRERLHAWVETLPTRSSGKENLLD